MDVSITEELDSDPLHVNKGSIYNKLLKVCDSCGKSCDSLKALTND